jgi:probable F420-dependent oxidoreductase
VSARTERIKIGSLVLVLPQREPWLVAKQLGTLDALNGGRTIVGIGMGWLREEFDVLHAPFDDRSARMEEMVALLRNAWTSQPAAFEGKYWQAPPVGVLPHPVLQPIPIWVGGSSPAARKRVASYGDGWAAFGLTAEQFARGWDDIESRATMNGRDPGSLTGMVWLPLLYEPGGTDSPWVPLHGDASLLLEQLTAYAKAGVDHLVMFNLAPPEAMHDQLAAIARDLLPAVHAL